VLELKGKKTTELPRRRLFRQALKTIKKRGGKKFERKEETGDFSFTDQYQPEMMP
jgi:hypothetical protein